MTLRVQNRPPDTKRPPGYRITLPIRNDLPGSKSPSEYRNTLPIAWLMRDFGGSAGLERAEMSGEGGAAYEGGSVAGLLGC